VNDDEVGRVFSALADPTRREIVRRLAEEGPVTPSRLAAGLPISRQGVTKHLATLELARLVVVERVGREARYELDTRAFADAEAWMRAIGASWNLRLADLKTLLEAAGMRVGEAG
jgi:DNA-binding transcriptional ArsR family regulator